LLEPEVGSRRKDSEDYYYLDPGALTLTKLLQDRTRIHSMHQVALLAAVWTCYQSVANLKAEIQVPV